MTRFLVAFFLACFLSACSGKVEHNYSDYHPQVGEDLRDSKMSSIITKNQDPIMLYGPKKGSSENATASGMANSYLWKATLESVAFMPLISSDSNGGAIITDWYSSPESPNEQFKFNIFILNSELQISSIKVVAFKQVRHGSGNWHYVKASKELSNDIEDSILKKAVALKAKVPVKK